MNLAVLTQIDTINDIVNKAMMEIDNEHTAILGHHIIAGQSYLGERIVGVAAGHLLVNLAMVAHPNCCPHIGLNLLNKIGILHLLIAAGFECNTCGGNGFVVLKKKHDAVNGFVVVNVIIDGVGQVAVG